MNSTRRKALALVATVAAMVWACGGDDAATNGDAGSDATTTDGGATDGSANDGGATVPPPSSLMFLDFDPSAGGVDGFIHVGHAGDDATLTGYSIFYGKSATEKLQTTPITTVPKSVPEEAGFPLSVAPIPAGAAFLLAFSETADGRESAPVATKLDRTPAYVDLGDGGMNFTPTVVVDHVSAKLLIGYSGTDGFPHVIRCELDGSACTNHIISGGGSISTPSLAIEPTSSSLLAVWEGADMLVMARCNLDLTGCHTIDISAGEPRAAGTNPSVVIDKVERKILVTATDNTNGARPGLFYCDLAIGVDGGDAVREDGGAACSFVDISAGSPAGSANAISNPALEAVSGKLVVATDDGANSYTTSVFRCNHDGTSCTYQNLDGDAGEGAGGFPSLIYDPSDDSVFITSTNESATSTASILHCNAAFTSCSTIDLTGASPLVTTQDTVSTLDDSNDKIFAATRGSGSIPLVVRCSRDGGSCHAYDMSAGQPAGSAVALGVAADPASSLFIVARTSVGTSTKPVLFLLR